MWKLQEILRSKRFLRTTTSPHRPYQAPLATAVKPELAFARYVEQVSVPIYIRQVIGDTADIIAQSADQTPRREKDSEVRGFRRFSKPLEARSKPNSAYRLLHLRFQSALSLLTNNGGKEQCSSTWSTWNAVRNHMLAVA